METFKQIRSKIEQNKADKKNRLLENALELFGTKGFKKTSISDIVEKAGVAKGTFYLYFKNKDDIRNELVAEKSTELFDHAIADLLNEKIDKFEDRLIFIVNHVIEDLRKSPAIMRFINKDLSLGFYSDELSKIYDPENQLYTLFKEGIEKDDLSVENVDMTFYTILELIGITCYRCLIQQIPCDIETYKPYLFKAIKAILHNS